MSSRVYIRELVERNGIEPIGPIVDDPDVQNGFLIFVRMVNDGDGAKPSASQISRTLTAAKESGSFIKFAYINDKEAILNSAVNDMLKKKHDSHYENAVVSLSASEASVFVETSDDTTNEDQEAIQGSILELLGYMQVENLQIQFSRSLKLPTATTCLAVVRRYAPVTTEGITRILQARGFDRPTDGWTSKTLDGLRKKGMVYRRPDKNFIMTLKGLRATGTSRSRLSPDVVRALALSRAGR